MDVSDAMKLADQESPLPHLAGEALRVLRAEVESLRNMPPNLLIPDDWTMVPIDPTPEIMIAGSSRKDWRDMLAAAPQPPEREWKCGPSAERVARAIYERIVYAGEPLQDVLDDYNESHAVTAAATSVLAPIEPDADMLDRAVAFALNVSLGGEYNWTAYMRDLWSRFVTGLPVAPDRPADASKTIPPGWRLVPAELTAENGAKAALIGAFSVNRLIECPHCEDVEPDNCALCDGKGTLTDKLQIDWSTIKEIYRAIVEHFAAAQQPPTPEMSDYTAGVLDGRRIERGRSDEAASA